MDTFRKYALAAITVAALAITTGCNTNTTGLDFVPVRGQVLLDGTPLAGADVEFIPQNIEPNEEGLGGSGGFSNTDDSGNFEMYTASIAGIQPGQYQVRISKIAQPEITDPEAQVPEGKQLVPARYNTMSDLIVEVDQAGERDLKFELSSK